MSVFDSNQIEQIVDVLTERDCRLYHFAHYQDFISYLEVRGIPSRELLESSNLPFTDFSSDESDKVNGVWDKIFLNLQDLGAPFHRREPWTPCVYGTIQFVFHPTALLEFEALAISFVTGGQFGKADECVSSIVELEKIFQFEEKSEPKWIKNLQATFPNKRVDNNVEVVGAAKNKVLSLESLEKVVVEPLYFDGTSYHGHIRNWLRSYDFDVPVECRESSNLELYQELIAEIASGRDSANALASSDTSETVREWARRMPPGTLNQFIEYYLRGTHSKIQVR